MKNAEAKSKAKAKSKKTTAPQRGLGNFNADDLIKSMAEFDEALKHGQVHTLRSTTISLPDPSPMRSAGEVRAVREKMGASQAVFAALLNVPLRTVSSWENSQRKPSGAALKLLDIAATHPEIFLTKK